ncbi:uncharacterized protein [Typha latifolia]|uniref:uncharacterized protein n=1 Tax=Typha latifolia TaxID=4733 RepID=UPI003C2C722A
MAAMRGGAVASIHSLSIPQPRRPNPTQIPIPFKEENTQKPQPNDLTPFPSPLRRRAALLLFLLPSIASSSAASAFSFGISGPKEWLREQKKKAAKFVLAPIEASRKSLSDAHLLLTSGTDSEVEEIEEVRRLLGSAARDCVPEQRNSIVAFQSRTGVEVCTFSLLVKNAASLLDERDPVKLEAEARLSDVVRSFSALGNLMDDDHFHLATDRDKLRDGLMDTISALNKFEQGIKDCLGI